MKTKELEQSQERHAIFTESAERMAYLRFKQYVRDGKYNKDLDENIKGSREGAIAEAKFMNMLGF